MEKRKFKKLITTKFTFVLVIALVLILNTFGFRFGLDFIVLTLTFFALIIGESRTFIKDWYPPILLFYLYEAGRGLADQIFSYLNIDVIYEPLIKMERALFFFLDEVPPVKLQYALLPDRTAIHWFDYIFFFFYVMFFWYWLLAGFIIWLKKRKYFKPYIYGLVAFSLFDVLIYIFFPTAPPWAAYGAGYLPEIHRVLWDREYFPGLGTASIVSTYSRNDFAAFPSHHFAWPFFATLFLVKAFGKKAVPLFIVPLMIGFATWYGAEHYVIDSIAGGITALITYYLSLNWKAILSALKGFVGKLHYSQKSAQKSHPQ